MRKLLLKLHMYLLLICSSYLLIFGVSSLLFNHPIEHQPEVVKWQATIAPSADTDVQRQAQSAADSLGLVGWVISWETRRDADGTLHTGIARPGKQYSLTVAPDGKASVEEKRQGFVAILHFLHGGMFVPGSALISSWAWYTRVCTIAVLFACITGVYLFATRPSPRRPGWIALGVAGIASIGMMIWMVTLA